MSDRGSHHKVKSMNLQEFTDIHKSCTKFLEPSCLELKDFTLTTRNLEKELVEIDPDQISSPKEIPAAISKAVTLGLEKMIRILCNEGTEGKSELSAFIQDFIIICRDFAVLLRKSVNPMKVEKNVVGHINTLLVTLVSRPDTLDYSEFILMLINVLLELVSSKKKKIELKDQDLCGQVYSSLQDILLRIITEADKESLSSTPIHLSGLNKKVSLFYSLYQDSVSTDLVHYLLLSIESLMKIDPSMFMDFIKSALPQILVHLLDIPDFHNTALSLATDLAISKYLVSLNILKLLCQSSNKLDLCRNFLKGNSEKIKNIFFYTLLSYSKYYFVMNGSNFEHDDGVLGRLYKTLYDILLLVAANSEQEGFPILLFSVILQNVRET